MWCLQRLPVLACCSWTLVIYSVAALALGLELPALTGRVVDEANIIPAAERELLEAKSKELENKSGIQLVVATVASLRGTDIETLANELFRKWKLGEARNNNGVLFLVAPKQRKVRIEVGYGLEATLTDALSSVIVSSAVLPRFKANDYAGGIERGVDGIIAILTNDAVEWQPRTQVRVDEHQTVLDWALPLILLAVFLFVFTAMLGHARGPSARWGRRDGRAIFVPYGGSPWGGATSGSSWGGGQSSGGGFAGGGGSSGGGGASGTW
jgi:uncharacterized protein